MSEFEVIGVAYLFSEMSDLRDDVLEVVCAVDRVAVCVNKGVSDGGGSLDECGIGWKTQVRELREGVERYRYGQDADVHPLDVGEERGYVVDGILRDHQARPYEVEVNKSR